jgi:hypothetical protein
VRLRNDKSRGCANFGAADFPGSDIRFINKEAVGAVVDQKSRPGRILLQTSDRLFQMQLKSQISLKLNLNTDEAARLVEQTGDFHDADLSYISSMRRSVMLMSIRIPQWIFLSGSNEVDQLTTIRFTISKPEFSSHWGTDEEICRCMIYNLFVSGKAFDLQTGDGGRTGKFHPVRSNVEIVTTHEILKLLGLI